MISCAKNILTECIAIKPTERILFLFDKFGMPMADLFSESALEIGCDICFRYVTFEEQRYMSEKEEYLSSIRHCIAGSDVLIFSISDSDDSSRFRVKILNSAVVNASKIIHMPGVTDEILFKSTSGLKLFRLQQSCESLFEKMRNAKIIKINTKSHNGNTHTLKLSIIERRFHICGGKARPSEILNLPTGEVYVAPIEGSAEGSLVLNGSAPDCVFRYPEEVVLKFNSGVLDIEHSYFPDKPNSIRLREQTLLKAKAKGTDNITLGEFGVGLNESVKELTGNVIMDEKALGTAHIALGANSPFGGMLNCRTHHDLIFLPICVKIDGRPLEIKWRKVNN